MEVGLQFQTFSPISAWWESWWVLTIQPKTDTTAYIKPGKVGYGPCRKKMFP